MATGISRNPLMKKPRMEFITEDLSEKYGLVYRTERITPEIAKIYLTHNSSTQRKLRPDVLAKYISDLSHGQWQLNGEAIIFGKDGTLLNGQHRLYSIIKSGADMITTVIYGIDEESVSIYDIQARRTPTDRLHISDIDLAPCVTTAARALVGMFCAVGEGVVTQYIKEHEDELRRAYTTCCKGASGKGAKRASCVLASYLMLRTKTMPFFEIETFYQIFNTGSKAAAGKEYNPSPAFVAKDMFETMDNAQIRRIRTQTEILVRALEDFAAKKECKTHYRLDDTEHWVKYANEIRKADGIS